jgi:hypothetical protein
MHAPVPDRSATPDRIVLNRAAGDVVATARHVVHITPSIISHRASSPSRGRSHSECMMDELNGRMIACQILITGLIARVANNSPDPLRFLTDFRDEIKAVVKGVNIAGMDNTRPRAADCAANRRRGVFADEGAQRGLIGAGGSRKTPDIRAFPALGLERFKYNLRTVSSLGFRIVLIWMDSNIPMQQSH